MAWPPKRRKTTVTRIRLPKPASEKKKREPFPYRLDAPKEDGLRRFEAVIPDWHPTTLNALLEVHWAKAGRLKRGDAELVAYYLKIAGVTAATRKRRLTYTIVYKAGPGGRADSDAHDKSFRDALTLCGALVDDSPKWLDAEKPLRDTGPRKETRIILEDIE